MGHNIELHYIRESNLPAGISCRGKTGTISDVVLLSDQVKS